jgi:ribosomal protein L11 methyltransferase
VQPGGSARYWDVSVATSPETSEALTNFLWELGALGVVEEETPARRPRVRAFFAATTPADALAERIEDYIRALNALGFRVSSKAEVTALRDERWADAWREHFRPVPVGRRLLVLPPWCAGGTSGRIAIIIEPGRAFGTGHHASTAGSLLALEHLLERGVPSRAIDLGTGSGILAIAAARLGVMHVTAIDEDPDAVACAIANAARNGVSDRVRATLGQAGSVEIPAAPLVLANLLSAAHHRLASRYAALVTDGGSIILAGILDGEASGVQAAITAAGFAHEESMCAEGWTTLVMRRDAKAGQHATRP